MKKDLLLRIKIRIVEAYYDMMIFIVKIPIVGDIISAIGVKKIKQLNNPKWNLMCKLIEFKNAQGLEEQRACLKNLLDDELIRYRYGYREFKEYLLNLQLPISGERLRELENVLEKHIKELNDDIVGEGKKNY